MSDEKDLKFIDTKTFDELVVLNKRQAEIIQDLMARNDKLKKALAKYMRPLNQKGDL